MKRITASQLLIRYASGERVFASVDLSGADLGGANLSEADLHGADLRWANLHGANLRWANLHGANLSGADLGGANLSGAYLYGANLSGAYLYGANLCGADLSGANLPNGSHDVVAELLQRTAGDNLKRLMIAGLVLIQRQWCWRDFAKALQNIDADDKQWIRDTLAPYQSLKTALDTVDIADLEALDDGIPF
jgi:hypothetical protein